MGVVGETVGGCGLEAVSMKKNAWKIERSLINESYEKRV